MMFRRLAQLLVGLILYGFAIAMMVQAGIGVSPWDVLTQGIARQTGLAFGLITNVVGLLVLLLWIPIRQRPGLGTLLNVLLIGPSAQFGLWLLPVIREPWEQVLLFAGGLALLALATGLYIGARFGPGPRDGLMTGIHRRWGWRLWIVRTSIEVTVLAIGWLLGGNVGVGTVLFAVLIGPMVNVTIPLLTVPASIRPAVPHASVTQAAAPPAAVPRAAVLPAAVPQASVTPAAVTRAAAIRASIIQEDTGSERPEGRMFTPSATPAPPVSHLPE